MSTKEYQKAWHQANKDRRLVRIKEARKTRADGLNEWLRTLKESLPCTDCREFHPHYVMDYDHLGDKVLNISNAVGNGWSKKKIQEEIDKCELVCANCHRKRTHARMLLWPNR